MAGYFEDAASHELAVLSFTSFVLGVLATLLCLCIGSCACTKRILAAVWARLCACFGRRGGDDYRPRESHNGHGNGWHARDGWQQQREEDEFAVPGGRLLGSGGAPPSESAAHRTEGMRPL